MNVNSGEYRGVFGEIYVYFSIHKMNNETEDCHAHASLTLTASFKLFQLPWCIHSVLLLFLIKQARKFPIELD